MQGWRQIMFSSSSLQHGQRSNVVDIIFDLEVWYVPFLLSSVGHIHHKLHIETVFHLGLLVCTFTILEFNPIWVFSNGSVCVSLEHPPTYCTVCIQSNLTVIHALHVHTGWCITICIDMYRYRYLLTLWKIWFSRKILWDTHYSTCCFQLLKWCILKKKMVCTVRSTFWHYMLQARTKNHIVGFWL